MADHETPPETEIVPGEQEVLSEAPPDTIDVDPIALSLTRLSDVVERFVEASQAQNNLVWAAMGHMQTEQASQGARLAALEQGRAGSDRLGRTMALQITARIRAITTLTIARGAPTWRKHRHTIDAGVRRVTGVSPRMRWEDVDARRLPAIERALDAAQRTADLRLDSGGTDAS